MVGYGNEGVYAGVGRKEEEIGTGGESPSVQSPTELDLVQTIVHQQLPTRRTRLPQKPLLPANTCPRSCYTYIPSVLMPRLCRGCLKHFTNSGYLSHLLQTKQPSCIQVREEEEASGHLALQERAIDDDPEDPEDPEDALPPQAAGAFEGDYFGDYAPADFEDYDEYEGSDQSDREDDEDTLDITGSSGRESPGEEDDDAIEDAQNYADEAAWEAPPSSPPPRSPAQHSVVDLPEDSGPSENVRDHPPLGATRNLHERAHEHLRRRTHIVRYPRASAGAPVSQDKARTDYEAFKSSLGASSPNPYAPFTSKVDWEFARWAKMRGPGSTAVTELLSITEVRRLCTAAPAYLSEILLTDTPAPWSLLQDVKTAQCDH